MNLSEIQQLDGAYMAETFSRFPVAIERGKGATLYDTDGKRYIDFGAGIARQYFRCKRRTVEKSRHRTAR